MIKKKKKKKKKIIYIFIYLLIYYIYYIKTLFQMNIFNYININALEDNVKNNKK